MTKKRPTNSESFPLQDFREGRRPRKIKPTDRGNDYLSEPASTTGKQENHIIVRQWVTERVKEKLQRTSRISLHTHKPIVLYRNSIEESEGSIEEEVSFISGSHIVQIIYVYGGHIPTTFKTIEIFTIEKFIKWFVQDGKRDLLLQCLEEL